MRKYCDCEEIGLYLWQNCKFPALNKQTLYLYVNYSESTTGAVTIIERTEQRKFQYLTSHFSQKLTALK
jgi:hypothetical protein